MQKTKGLDKKKELQAQLTRVQQQIQDERSKRRKEAWEAEQKVNFITVDCLLIPWHGTWRASIRQSSYGKHLA